MESGKEYGFFPLNVTPGILNRFLGCSTFSLDADRVSFEVGGEMVEIPFSELEQVTNESGKLNFICFNGKKFQVRLAQDSEKVFNCANQLLNDFREFDAFKKNSHDHNPQERFAFFLRSFNFKARPFVWAVESLMKIALLENISDIHFEPLSERVKVTFRSSGKVSIPGEIGYESYHRFLARVKFLAGCLSHISDKAQEGAFRDEDTELDVRASTFPTDLGERLSIRLISPLRYNSLSSLGWKEGVLQEWRDKAKAAAGLYIISGAVGSGKTTALYATLAELAGNNGQLRVVTLEDPVEGRVPSICQSSLDSMKGLSLAQAFKHLLRQDPDIIALGEIRDRECLKEALQAGLSGHTVFATFHAGSGKETIDRIKQMGLEEYLVMSGLRAIIHLELSHGEQGPKANASIIGCQDERP